MSRLIARIAALFAVFALTLTGCERESRLENSMEDVAESVEGAAESLGDGVGDAVDSIGDDLEEAGDSIDDALNN